MVKAAKNQVKGRGNHPNTRKALAKTQFKPGESGNPLGVPVGTKQRSTILKRWLEVEREIDGRSNPTKKNIKGTVEDEIMLALIQKALKGDVAAIKEVQDTLYGKLTDKTEHSFDLSSLSTEELITLERITAKLTK